MATRKRKQSKAQSPYAEERVQLRQLMAELIAMTDPAKDGTEGEAVGMVILVQRRNSKIYPHVVGAVDYARALGLVQPMLAAHINEFQVEPWAERCLAEDGKTYDRSKLEGGL